MESERFADLGVIVESATDTPRIEFVLPGGIRGLDYAAEERKAPTNAALQAGRAHGAGLTDPDATHQDRLNWATRKTPERPA